MTTGPAQGWYIDTQNLSKVRWSEGNAWSGHTERNPMAVPAFAQIPGGSVPPPSVLARNFSGWFNDLYRLVFARIGHLFTFGAVFSPLPSLLQGLVTYLVFREAELRIDYLTDEVSYLGPGVVGFVVLSAVVMLLMAPTPFMNTMSTPVMQAGVLALYKDFEGEVDLGRLGSGDGVNEVAEGFDSCKASPPNDGTFESRASQSGASQGGISQGASAENRSPMSWKIDQ